MNVEPQGRIEPLYHCHGTGLERAYDSDPARAPAQPGRHRAHEQTQHEAGQRRVEGHLVAKTVRDSQNSLSDRHSGQDLIDEVKSGVGHPPADARRAETAALTRKRHKTALAAVLAASAKKTMRQDAAFEKGLDLSDHEAGESSSVARNLQARQEGSPVLLQRLVEQRFFGVGAARTNEARSAAPSKRLGARRLQHPVSSAPPATRLPSSRTGQTTSTRRLTLKAVVPGKCADS